MAPEVASKPEPEGEGGARHGIPQERVNAMIAKATADAEAKAAAAEERARLESERRIELEARTQAQSAAPAQAEKNPPPSREQLRSLVDAGEITQDQMDAEMERQMEVRLSKRFQSEQSTKTRAAKINDEIDAYMEKLPDLKDRVSDTYKRVQAEYQALLKRGYASDATTELLALRSILGDPSKIRIPETGNADRQVDDVTHSGAGGSDEGTETKEPGPMKGLLKHHVDYYQSAIDKGRFSGWDDERLKKIQKRALAKK